MPALRFALAHPDNQGRPLRTVLGWVRHTIRRRLTPQQVVTVYLGPSSLMGPARHPVISLAQYVHSGLYDYDAFQTLMALLRPGDTFIDVGASIGAYSALAGCLLGPTGFLVVIEPAPEEVTWLRTNLAQRTTPHLVLTTPLADQPRAVELSGAATLQHLTAGGGGMATTLDAVLADLEFDRRRSFLKIDVEGWDGAVVAGARDWLAQEPLGLLLEANEFAHRSPVAWPDVVALVQGAGFRFVWPEVARGILHEFADPPARSPFNNYFALSQDALELLRGAVAKGALAV